MLLTCLVVAMVAAICDMELRAALLLLLVFCVEMFLTHAKHLLGRAVAEVGAGNYTYTPVRKKGAILVFLESRMGDADLYVSDKTSTPSFSNYELQSTTCGHDEVVIPKSMTRPVHIGIYGHPNFEVSTYEISIYLLETMSDYDTENDYNTDEPTDEELSDDQHSLAWDIFCTLIKILVEAML